ncbi:MAG TPA: hypothetical protein VFY89_05855, partial [Ktedonobacterales bacterium]
EAGTSAALALFIQQHQAPDRHLLTKAERLAELHARPLGWSNTLPVVIRPEPDELAYLRAAHQKHAAHAGPHISPAPISGTPPWHPEPE